MPISLLEFKDYCSIPIQAKAGTRSSGIVSVSRLNVLSQVIITIPLNTVFSVSTGQSFQNPEVGELNESQTFIPLLLQSTTAGADQNIPARSMWNTPISGIMLHNTSPFSGGQDDIPESNIKSFILNRFNIPSDFILQLMLDQSQSKCMDIIGKPAQIPDTVSFRSGVYFLGRYYLETRSKIGFETENGVASDILQERKVIQGIEDKVHEGVMRVLTGMLTADRNPKAFMPEVQSESS